MFTFSSLLTGKSTNQVRWWNLKAAREWGKIDNCYYPAERKFLHTTGIVRRVFWKRLLIMIEMVDLTGKKDFG
jgi:hypothetical protein